MASQFIYYWLLNIVGKNVNFWNEGTITLASSVQEVSVIFKLIDLQSLSKAIVDL